MPRPADSDDIAYPQSDDSRVPRRRRPSGVTGCMAGLVLGLAGLAATRLGQLWIAFDVFSNFTLQFAAVALAFLIGLLMPRGRLMTASVLLVAGLTALGVWPHLASQSATASVAAPGPGERALQVASFNTLWVNDDAEAVRAEVARIDADVILLIEMGPSKRSIPVALRERYPHQADCYEFAYCNFVVLSKIPIAESEAMGQWEGPPFIRVKLGEEAGGLTVFGVHTTRFPHSRAQFRQVAAIAARIEATPGRKLVMGDFNATPFSRLLSGLESRATLTRLTHLPSWPSYLGLPQLAIDHIFVSPGIRALGPSRIGEPAGSDHYPVMMPIAVPLRP